jgi:hypothetical protein
MKRRARLMPALLLLGGTTLLMGSLMVAVSMGRAVASAREDTLPLAAVLAPLERREALLQSQAETAELHATLDSGSLDEELRAYVLPASNDVKRLLSVFETIIQTLTRQGNLRTASSIDVGDPRSVVLEGADALTVQPVRMKAVVREEGARTLTSFLHLSGLLTIADVIDPKAFHDLLEKTMEENPAALPALQQFLATDLLAYARDPQPFEERLAHTFSDERVGNALRTTLESPLMTEARRMLGGEFGNILRDQKLWPTQFIAIDSIDLQERPDGWYDLAIEMHVYARKAEKART